MTLHIETVPYELDGATFRGELVYDDRVPSPRPGVLVAHEALGLGEHPRRRARMLADLGYAAFALDMYGEGRAFYGPEAMMQMNGLLKAPDELRRRAVAACETFQRLPQVDSQRIAAIGYCFGGRVVIDLARSGAALKGVASFHGLLVRGALEEDLAIQAKLLVCTGAEDPMVPPEAVQAFQEGLRAADADWQLITYGGARHAFTNRDAAAAHQPALAYNECADRHAWTALQWFLEEVLA